MGNILVNQQLMDFLFDKVLLQLYSLDLFKLKCRHGLR